MLSRQMSLPNGEKDSGRNCFTDGVFLRGLQEGFLKSNLGIGQNRKYFCTHKEGIGDGLCVVRHGGGQLLSQSTNATPPGDNRTGDRDRGLMGRCPASIAMLMAWGGSRERS